MIMMQCKIICDSIFTYKFNHLHNESDLKNKICKTKEKNCVTYLTQINENKQQ